METQDVLCTIDQNFPEQLTDNAKIGISSARKNKLLASGAEAFLFGAGEGNYIRRYSGEGNY